MLLSFLRKEKIEYINVWMWRITYYVQGTVVCPTSKLSIFFVIQNRNIHFTIQMNNANAKFIHSLQHTHTHTRKEKHISSWSFSVQHSNCWLDTTNVINNNSWYPETYYFILLMWHIIIIICVCTLQSNVLRWQITMFAKITDFYGIQFVGVRCRVQLRWRKYISTQVILHVHENSSLEKNPNLFNIYRIYLRMWYELQMNAKLITSLI